MNKISTKWGSDKIEVWADWSQASGEVMGDIGGGYQVADFHHSPHAALRKALEQCASADGMPMSERAEAIEAAMSLAVEE